VAAAATWSYLQRARSLGVLDRSGLLVLRGALFALLLVLLLRPTLQVPVAVSQENYLGILVDDSRSMMISDGGATTRAEDVLGQLDSGLLEALSQRFRLRLFRFAGDAQRVEAVGDLTFAGGMSRIGRALDQAHSELAGVPVAGLVVISDGADQSEADLN